MDLQSFKNSDLVSQMAVILGKRCYKQKLKDENKNATPSSNSKYRQPGGERKDVALNVREALYDWVVDVHEFLKVRLANSLLKSQVKYLYDQWLDQQPEDEKQQLELLFSNKWIKN